MSTLTSTPTYGTEDLVTPVILTTNLVIIGLSTAIRIAFVSDDIDALPPQRVRIVLASLTVNGALKVVTHRGC